MFKYYSRDSDEQDATSQYEEEGGGHADFSLTDLVVFILREYKVTVTKYKDSDNNNTYLFLGFEMVSS